MNQYSEDLDYKGIDKQKNKLFLERWRLVKRQSLSVKVHHIEVRWERVH